MRWRRKIIGCAILPVLLVSCALPPPVIRKTADPVRLWQAREVMLGRLANWGLRGRIAMKQGRKAWQTHVIACWREGDGYRLDFLSLFGQQQARLEGVPGAVTLYLPKAKRVTARDPDQLLKAQLGWSIPVRGLRSWIRGLPVGSLPADRVLDQAGRITRMDQQGWSIEYRRYTVFEHVDMPKMLIFRRDELRLQLVVDRWLSAEQCLR